MGLLEGIDFSSKDSLQTIGQFLVNPYGSVNGPKWDLIPGSFTPEGADRACTFWYVTGSKDSNQNNKVATDLQQKTALDQVSDGGGRRLAVYEYPYRDGQALMDMGRKGEKYTFQLKFFGSNYLQLFNEFLNQVVNSNKKGTLTHPVRKNITCRFQEYSFLSRHDEWQAITIQATFLEDNLNLLNDIQIPVSPNQGLKDFLNSVSSAQAKIQQGIFNASALKAVPGTIINALQNRLKSITGQSYGLLGALAASFSSDSQLQLLVSQQSTALSAPAVKAYTTSSGATVSSSVPTVYQVGFTPTEQTSVTTQINQYVSSNQVTPQQAVYQGNQIRENISKAIAELRSTFGNDAYEMETLYRQIAVQLQETLEVAISSSEASTLVYRVPYDMSLRMIAFKCGLTPDAQNAIEALNPNLPSLNLVPAETEVVVPLS